MAYPDPDRADDSPSQRLESPDHHLVTDVSRFGGIRGDLEVQHTHVASFLDACDADVWVLHGSRRAAEPLSATGGRMRPS